MEDFASDEEAPHAAPRTPPHAGRLACGKSPDEPGTGGQAEATKVQQGDFDLEALDAANQELADLEAKPSEPSEASEDEGQAEDGGALPEEPWERWSRRERELWERVRPRHLRREAHQVQGLRLPAAVLTRLLRLHPQMHSKSSEALEIINHSTVLLLQAVAKAAVRGKAPGKRVSFEDVKSACGGQKELHFLQPLSCTLDASTFQKNEAVRSDVRRGDAEAAAALPLGEVTPEEKDKKRKAATTGQKPHKAKKAKTEKVPAAKTGLETFFRRATEAA